MKINGMTKIIHSASWLFFLISIAIIAGCASTAKDDDSAAQTDSQSSTADSTRAEGSNATTESKSSSNKAAGEKPEEKDVSMNVSFSAASEAVFLTPIVIMSTTNRDVPQRAKSQPAGVIDFCKVKPYAKYKKQVKKGVSKAWADYKAGTYGVGFRNKTEYKKWKKTQDDFFLYIFAACRDLALCEIDKKKNKKKSSCNVQQVKFDAWQNSAKLFSAQVKNFKSQQPSALCSLQPNNSDVSLCFKKRAEQIDEACDAATCQELSQCWVSVAMKDDVIRQAESSCRFSGQKLSKCSGYTGAIKSRKVRFSQCNDMQKDLDLSF